ncbi:MAG: baseplate J/gp47 family protein [Bacilli bacterium]|nr:baseplate J/gp47 family protein [Bacilli bacterium]
MEKKINYLSRDFESVKKELLEFCYKYYPELFDNFNDSSVGSWFIDLVSSVADELSYHTDRMYQETNVNSSNLRSSALNNARANGIKVMGAKPSVCEVELTCELPIDSSNISKPNFDYAPLIKMGSTVGNSQNTFELSEDVDFSEQFNKDGYSNRKYTPIRDANGSIISYKVTKNVVVLGGKSKVYKKLITMNDLKPFMEIILPEKNIMCIDSIIFKESEDLNIDPDTSEYFIDEEVFRVKNQSINTYRYFEVNSLSDLYRFGTDTEENVDVYEDYTESDESTSSKRTTRIYKGKWKALTQKFITEYTDNGYLKIIFGGATDKVETPDNGQTYSDYYMSNIINNNMLGLLPKSGWTMYVLYKTQGGIESNVAQGSINSVININATFPKSHGLNTNEQSSIIKSIKVYNPTTAIGGKDEPSTEEIKWLTKYGVQSQERCVTIKDYKYRVMQIPPKYGCPFRCNVVEDNNKVSMSMLTIDANGDLSNAMPKLLMDNIVEYISNYKSLTDYVEIRSGKIYNIGVELDVFIDKNYTTHDVVRNIINIVSNYFDVNKHDMGGEIFIGDLEKEINASDGVISIIDTKIYNIYGGNYNDIPCPLPTKDSSVNPCYKGNNNSFIINNATANEIDLNAIDKVLYNDYDSMFEIKNPENDIKIRVKLK